jgi:hypothetical protein
MSRRSMPADSGRRSRSAACLDATRLPSARGVVDYALARRSALFALTAGRTSAADVCDAQTYLLRAARYHGEPIDEPCPVCGGGSLTSVTYTYGDCFRGDTNGRARRSAELVELDAQLAEFSVFVVEVCPDCRWNHLVTSYVLGAAAPRRRARS